MSQDHVSDREGDHEGDHEREGSVHESSSGHPLVDEVLRTLDELSDRPVDEHVAVFEAAHAGLRDALQDARPAAPAHG